MIRNEKFSRDRKNIPPKRQTNQIREYSMSPEERSRRINLVRKLRARTVANGCTESEALEAADKAGKIMDEFSVSFEEIDMSINHCEQAHTKFDGHEVYRIADSIARFCECKYWLTEGNIKYFGFDCDVEIALYLTDLCRSAMDTSFRLFLGSPERPPLPARSLRKSFMVAMADRLSQRIRTMTADRLNRKSAYKGNSLVKSKLSIVEKEFMALGIKLSCTSRRGFRENDSAGEAGWAAGGRVNISPGINTNSKVLLIGHRPKKN